MPLVAALESWMRPARAKLSRHADVAKAMDYMLKNIGDQCCRSCCARAHRNARSVPRRRQVVRQVSDGIGSDLDSAGLFSELARL